MWLINNPNAAHRLERGIGPRRSCRRGTGRGRGRRRPGRRSWGGRWPSWRGRWRRRWRGRACSRCGGGARGGGAGSSARCRSNLIMDWKKIDDWVENRTSREANRVLSYAFVFLAERAIHDFLHGSNFRRGNRSIECLRAGTFKCVFKEIMEKIPPADTSARVNICFI